MTPKLHKSAEEWARVAITGVSITSFGYTLTLALADIATLYARIKTLMDQLDAAEKELHHWRESAGKIRDTGIPTSVELI